jgi:tubulin alpha
LREHPSVAEITNAVFEPANRMLKVDEGEDPCIACAMLYRGDVHPADINAAIKMIQPQRAIQFSIYFPTGFEIGICHEPPKVVPNGDFGNVNRALCKVAATSSFGQLLEMIGHRFDLLYAKNSFVHWYVREGMEKSVFDQAREALALLGCDYRQEQAVNHPCMDFGEEDYDDEESQNE